MVVREQFPRSDMNRWRAAVAPAAGAAVLGLAGCQNTATPTSLASSATPPPVTDDATAAVVPPTTDAGATDPSSSPTAGPSAAPGTGGDGAGTTGTTTRQGSSSATGGRTTPGVADGATALPPTAAVADDARCRATSLVLEPLDRQGSPGGTYANFRLRNRSAGSCAVRGYVGATLVGDDGKDLPTVVRREDGPDVWVTIAKGGSAQFHLRYPNPYSGDAPCSPPNAAKLRITLTGMAGSLTGAAPEGSIQACGGRVSTAPVGST
jgi:hypothetical protein